MKIAVIGGGINGVMSAWQLAADGHKVTLFERDELMSATSSASTKLLHGGLRYLENGQLMLVREALQERTWWIENAPQLAHRLQIVIPLYRDSKRPAWMLKIGLATYDLLAGSRNLGRHRRLSREALLELAPELKSDGLLGGFAFYDGQMNDAALGRWAAEKAIAAGVEVRQHEPVERVSKDGEVSWASTTESFDRVVNVSGPWAKQLLAQSGIATKYDLDLVRGSHLILDRPIHAGFMLQVPGEERVCFALPYEGKTLLGTTEVRQSLEEPIRCSAEEKAYLIKVFNHYLQPAIDGKNVVRTFAGLRPLIRSAENPTHATREYHIWREGKLINVFGGKWTTSRILGQKVAKIAGKE
ncbi:FAD dependent oxidoreductase [Candidatus Koribacter versatilis Ellin345]|uniref:FAD dependent oxidoreductase n=1 Tax=Koribacter versatilis (strain Ellin345) TaxID=204669 RepID=Q1ILD5_KORVE|nr:glycerol-3-phosphate dehydrogenase/oxidase [Candidatus Koribacter versatilis]ABF42315.1 FAD dependent oxidoreductase [Candidatus Koribacter versatilis Ellin345]